MVSRLKVLRNLARFESYEGKDLNLEPRVLIFAPNGRGKSTIARVLRSLATGDTSLLPHLRTARPPGEADSGPPVAVVEVDGREVALAGDRWTDTCSQIEVFDEDFVRDNVHAGGEVSTGHRRNLCRFILGQKAVQLLELLEHAETLAMAATKELQLADARLRRHIVGDMTAEAFVGLVPPDDVEAVLAGQERDLANLEKEGAIRRGATAAKLVEVAKPALDIASIAAVLGTTLGSIAAEAATKVADYVRTMGDGGESWLQAGLRYQVAHRCPFCGADTTESELVDAYRTFFGEGYARLKQRIAESQRTLDGVMGEDPLLELANVLHRNGERLTFWQGCASQISLTRPPALQERWIEVRQHLARLLRGKDLSPSSAACVPDSVDRTYTELSADLDSYNSQVRSANSLIDRLVQSLAASDLAACQKEVDRLRNMRCRTLPDPARLCGEYEEAKQVKDRIDADKKRYRQELDGYADEFVTRTQGVLNEFLARSGVAFRVGDARKTYMGKLANIDYELELNDCSFPLTAFNTALSGGDKRTLAFAFFMSRLWQDEGLACKTVVLDDPMSSLDEHRRHVTVTCIADLASRCGQLIVLTHDKEFARDILSSVSDVQPLIIRRSNRQGSTIASWSPADDLDDQYRRDFRKLLAFSSGSPGVSPADVVRCIRPALECSLRQRFPDIFQGGKQLSDYIRLIDTCPPDSPLAALRPLAKELWEINSFSRRYHHAEGRSHVQIDEPELLAYTERAINILRATPRPPANSGPASSRGAALGHHTNPTLPYDRVS